MTPRILAALAMVLLAFPAKADCEDGIALLVPKIAGVADPHTRSLLEIDLKRAQIDMWEFDEVECAINLQHAARLLKFGA
jgi:hypothetical protein